MKITSTDQLRELYGWPSERAVKKQMSQLDEHAIRFISESPFFVLATQGASGAMDASPRGGTPGFVHIPSPSKIMIPDSKGNNRVDSLSNIVETGKVGLLFFIPGMDETLRVNGSAHITTDSALLHLFSSEKNLPKTIIVVDIEEAFLHCAKAFMRSRLWDSEAHIERSSFPTMGQMLKDQIGSSEAPESQEAMVTRYKEDL